MNLLEIPLKITELLRAAGISNEDLLFWRGINRLSSRDYSLLIQFLYTATAGEILNLNTLIKRKIEVFSSQKPEALAKLTTQETSFVKTGVFNG